MYKPLVHRATTLGHKPISFSKPVNSIGMAKRRGSFMTPSHSSRFSTMRRNTEFLGTQTSGNLRMNKLYSHADHSALPFIMSSFLIPSLGDPWCTFKVSPRNLKKRSKNCLMKSVCAKYHAELVFSVGAGMGVIVHSLSLGNDVLKSNSAMHMNNKWRRSMQTWKELRISPNWNVSESGKYSMHLDSIILLTMLRSSQTTSVKSWHMRQMSCRR